MEREKRCPQCDFINLEDAVLCISCAEQLPPENSPNGRVYLAESPVTEQIACTYCTYLNPPGMKICEMCSKTLHDTATNILRRNDSARLDIISCRACTLINPASNLWCEMCFEPLKNDDKVSNVQKKETDDIKTPADNSDPSQIQDIQTPLKTGVNNKEPKTLSNQELETPDVQAITDNACPVRSQIQDIQTPLKTGVNNKEPNTLSNQELETPDVQAITDNASPVRSKRHIQKNEGNATKTQIKETGCPVRPNALSNQMVETPAALSLTDNSRPVRSKHHFQKNQRDATKIQTKEAGFAKNCGNPPVEQLHQAHGIKGKKIEATGGKDHHMLFKKDNSFQDGFVEFPEEEIEESKRITQKKTKVHNATRQKKAILNPGPTKQTEISELLMSSQIQEACEDEDDYYDNQETKTVSCPRCESKCHCIYEEDRKLTCKTCLTPFCAGCRCEYSKSCNTNVSCALGSHCHHPRNCIYYLRGMSVTSLKRLLNDHGKTFDNKATWLCEKMRRGRDVKTMQADHNTEIFCEPYKEYLINIINERKLDPAHVMTEEELETAFTRETLGLPSDRTITSLRQFLMEECPLRPLR